MNRILLLVFATSFSILSNAQELISRVPNTAEFAIQVNWDKVDKIYSHKKILKNAMWKDVAKEGGMKSLLETGLDFAKPTLMSIDLTDSCTYFSIHAHIANEKMFYEFLARESRKMDMIKDYKGSGYDLIKSGRSDQALIGKGTATFVFSEMNRDYGYENMDYLMEVYYDEIRKYEYEYEQRNAIEAIMARNRMIELLQKNPTPFNTTECFKLFDKTNEVTLWMNNLYSQLGKTFSGREFREFGNVISTFNGYQAVNFALEKGKIDLEMRLNFSEDIKNDILEITKGRTLNKDFLKYIPADRVAIYSMSINPKAYYDWIKKSLMNTLGGNLVSDQSVKDIVGVLETLIDEDAIVKLLTGDVVMSFNGIKTMTTEYKSNRYNEDFEMKEVIRKKEIDYPEFTIVLGVNNHDFFQKIMNILNRENLLSDESGYMMIPPNRDFPSGLGIHLDNERMIISTDFQMLKDLGNKKFYQGHELNAKTNFYAEMRINNFFKKLVDETSNFGDYTFFDFMASTFDRIEFMANPNDEMLSANGSLYMKDQKKNAYVSFINSMNDTYVKMEVNRNENRYLFYSKRIEKLIAEYENLPADKKSMKGDEIVQGSKEMLKSKRAQEEPYLLRELIWGLEEVIEGNE